MDDLDAISVNAYNIRDYPTLPYNGWLKPCTNKNCRTITGQFIIYKYLNFKFKYYFCSPCKKHFECVKYIENNYSRHMRRKTLLKEIML